MVPCVVYLPTHTKFSPSDAMRCVVKVVARIIFGFNCLALIFSAVVAFLIDFSHQTPYSPVIERIMERGFCSSSSPISISIFHLYLYLYPYLWPASMAISTRISFLSPNPSLRPVMPAFLFVCCHPVPTTRTHLSNL